MMAAARRGGVAGLSGEACAELRRGVFAGEDEEIVEGGDGAAQRNVRQPLVQAVKEVEGAREEAAPGIGRDRLTPRAEVAVRPVVELKANVGMRRGQAEEDLA